MRVFIQKWSTDPALLPANVTFVLITENLADISSRIVRSPQTVEIEVSAPDEPERLQFLPGGPWTADWFKTQSDLPAERLAQLTSGLTRIQLRQILSSVDERGARSIRRRCASRRRRSSKPSALACWNTSSRATASTWWRGTKA